MKNDCKYICPLNYIYLNAFGLKKFKKKEYIFYLLSRCNTVYKSIINIDIMYIILALKIT